MKNEVSAHDKIGGLRNSINKGEIVKYHGGQFVRNGDKILLITDLEKHRGIPLTEQNIDKLLSQLATARKILPKAIP
ncbi:hypothetical protein COV56_02210 [Candidatus Kuenenbacteria bacterium CG11_big_fil_rev_8_21_14_0_20_37_9]|uniref:Uncharacterized protein n=2 Tax=Candidatus Kueneniibacteriota TaxID=1752740 RepID=A0A2M6XT74_9BACT|nr:MAG: hypothetical protein AUJ29_02780 [Candidatus Kuenenbacteria bacterium CG1_02_38_13]PIR05539.1 MAG: hypothetical protein COV56_02210 [Candidatus Kuenenbacteria bacterium CG11_big_fil_rev_8_21_14_0_20_37_9]PIU10848.1 MAG: hypothetical protein COT27_01065 [Candidatus Kuenenbacteria bacterium CG08_land_8_20_14_0_20_37_23]